MEQGVGIEDKSPPYLVLFISELLGTAILMYIGCMGCTVMFPGGPVVPAISFGMAIAAAIQAVGHISGAHINPAVSLGILILGKMTFLEFVIYVIGQFIGSLVGYGMLWIMMPAYTKVGGEVMDTGLCELKVGAGMTPLKVLMVEFCASWTVMFAISGMLDSKNRFKNDSSPLRVAFIVAGVILASVWHAGPLLGMGVAAFMYRFIFDSTERFSLYSCLTC